MSGADRTVITLSRLEARALSDLISQFAALLAAPSPEGDDALARLTPSPYPDDDNAAAEFHAATAGDLLDRRQTDALRMLADLAPSFASDDETATDPVDDLVDISFDDEGGQAWLRTLAALRMVIAVRLGIDTEANASRPAEDPDEERFAVYDWLGYRLELLVSALTHHR